MLATIEASLSSLRAVSITFAPTSASPLATASPSPPVAPVISTTLSVMSKSEAVFCTVMDPSHFLRGIGHNHQHRRDTVGVITHLASLVRGEIDGIHGMQGRFPILR